MFCSDCRINATNENVWLSENKEKSLQQFQHLNGWTHQASGRKVTSRLRTNAHVHERRREPDMLGCGPAGLRKYGVEKDGKVKCRRELFFKSCLLAAP